MPPGPYNSNPFVQSNPFLGPFNSAFLSRGLGGGAFPIPSGSSGRYIAEDEDSITLENTDEVSQIDSQYGSNTLTQTNPAERFTLDNSTQYPFGNSLVSSSPNTNMEGFDFSENGDFSLIFKGQVNQEDRDSKIYSDSVSGSSVGFDTNDFLYIEDSTGQRYSFPGVVNLGSEQIFIIKRDGDTLSAYNFYQPTDATFTVAGKTFAFNKIGAELDAFIGYLKDTTEYNNKALSDGEAEWWSYTRNEQGEVITDENGDPYLPEIPTPPSVIPVNTAEFNKTGDSYYSTSSNIFNGEDKLTIIMHIRIPTNPGSITTLFSEEYGANTTVGKLQIQYFPTSRFYIRGTTSSTTFTKFNPLSVSTDWAKVAIVLDLVLGNVKFYVNGVLGSSQSVPSGALITSDYGTPKIGLREKGGALIEPFLGSISYLGIAKNEILSLAEINEALGTTPDQAVDPSLWNQSLRDKFDHMWACSEGQGVNPTQDLVGSNDLTEIENTVGDFIYTDTGFEVYK